MKTTIEIIIADAGHIFVGETEHTDKGVQLSNASVIRRWGTTRGLGEIALGGPTSSTVLDKTGRVFIPTQAMICVISCEQDRWKNEL